MFEVHHEDLGAVNSWEQQPVGIEETTETFSGAVKMKSGSLKLLRIPLE